MASRLEDLILLVLSEEKRVAHGRRRTDRTTAEEASGSYADMVAQCRTEAIAAIAQPVETAATRTFQRIASCRVDASVAVRSPATYRGCSRTIERVCRD